MFLWMTLAILIFFFKKNLTLNCYLEVFWSFDINFCYKCSEELGASKLR